jgi:DnaJ-domain-containing protein 1
MPTNKRKGRRGKQRKDDNVPRNRDKKSVEYPSKREIAEIVRESMAQGCRVVRTDGGGIQVRHPVTMFGEDERLTNRELWNDEEKGVVVDNYIHHFAQEIRNGNFEGTKVIGGNLLCPHLGSKLIEALFEEDIHIALLDFLSKCDGRLSVALKDTVEKRVSLPAMWIEILTLMIGNDECSHETLVLVAKRLEPLVICMIHERRQLFRSNDTWHVSLGAFFYLMFYLMCQSKEARRVMLSYDGLLPFVAQASCWDVSRGDIAKEAARIRCGDDYVPRSFSTACREARKVICLVVEEHDIEEGEDADAPFSPLELIACTPLSNDPECKDSAMVGFVRCMRRDNDNLPSMLSVIIETLLCTGDYVDKRVIAELLDYGTSSQCAERGEFMFIMRLLLGILGAYGYGGIRPSDSRYAAAIRCDFLQFCNHVSNLTSDDEWELLTVPLKRLVRSLSVMSLHSKTSRVLASEKRAQFHLALETLAERHGMDLPVLDHFDDVGTSTCCNCLKKCEKKTLRLCNCCKIEQYCTLSCQAESWSAGHSRLCKKMAKESDYFRSQGVSEMDIKRLITLKSNLMAAGCNFIKSKITDILKMTYGDGEVAKHFECTSVLIDFGEVPPTIELRDARSNSVQYPGSLHVQFVAPVWYEFAARLGWNHVRLEKCIPQEKLKTMEHERAQPKKFEQVKQVEEDMKKQIHRMMMVAELQRLYEINFAKWAEDGGRVEKFDDFKKAFKEAIFKKILDDEEDDKSDILEEILEEIFAATDEEFMEYLREGSVEEDMEHAQVLGVSHDVDRRTLVKTHRKLALQYHPDKWSADSDHGMSKEEAEEHFMKIQNAYDHLMAKFDG